jgi:hypothetical protein
MYIPQAHGEINQVCFCFLLQLESGGEGEMRNELCPHKRNEEKNEFTASTWE